MTDFKPMLSGSLTDITKLRFPVIASPKLDGIRCIVQNGHVLSRKLKPIPNSYIRTHLLGMIKHLDADGEIMLRGGGDFNEIQSAVMREDGEPDFVYYVFDVIGGNDYADRLRILERDLVIGNHIQILHSRMITSEEELLKYEDEMVAAGYEGVMIRSVNGPYKYGRSTEKEGYLLKMKRFFDAEAEVIGFEQKMHNANEATKDELGRTKRSSAKAGLVPVEQLGALLLRTPDGIEFGIGTGYTDEQRTEIWANRESLLGATVTYKYQELSKYNVPRFPVFKCFRKD